MTKIDDEQNSYRWLKYSKELFLISAVETFKKSTANEETKIFLLNK